jgi:hypothetical protein
MSASGLANLVPGFVSLDVAGNAEDVATRARVNMPFGSAS